MELKELFENARQLNILVVGDAMIDKYQWGHVQRISPEAPVPIVQITKEENRLGGAANVALNCAAFGANVTLATVIGKDEHAQIIQQLLTEHHISTKLVQQSSARVTTCKSRIIAKGQHIVRLDQEITEDLNTKDEHSFIEQVLKFLQIQKPDVVILQDYNKGVLKENVIQKILNHCEHLQIIVAVDPKERNFFAYRGVTIFKPNYKEVIEALKLTHITPDLNYLNNIHHLLYQQLHHQQSLITLSEFGVFTKNNESELLTPSFSRKIVDVSGAGDTVIAVAAIIYALTKNASLMAEISNLAGGMVCEYEGVVPINVGMLEEEINKHYQTYFK